MAESDTTPMQDGDITPPPAGTEFQPAESLKNAGADFQPEGAGSDGQTGARQAIKDGASNLGSQATDKLRALAEDGKARAGGALDQLVQMLNDAAGQVDSKLGEQYGGYARNAAGVVSDLSESIKNKNLDDLVEDARGFVRQSPAIAIGTAAALGFVIARLVQSGLDAQQGSDQA